MPATFTHSVNTRISVGTALSETDISDNIDNSYFWLQRPIHGNTGFGASATENDPGLVNPLIFMEGPWDATLDGVISPLDGVQGKSIIYSPDLTTTGKPKYTYVGFIYGYKVTADNGAGGQRWQAFFVHKSGYTRGTHT